MLALRRGFTLVELVLVIVLLGIVATVTTSYLGLGARMYAEASDRDRLLSQSRFAIERLTRELRSALPNSIRVSADQQCIEFIPLLAAGRYEALPGVTAPAGNPMHFFTASEDMPVSNSQFVTVYPTQPAHYYSTASARTAALTSATISAGKVTLTFVNTSMAFEENSPSQRVFLWRQPVRYCVLYQPQSSDYRLYRYEDYGVLHAEPMATDNLAEGVLMAEQLSLPSATPPFTFEPGVLTRTSVVHIVLAFSSNFADDLFFNQEVHIPNVP